MHRLSFPPVHSDAASEGPAAPGPPNWHRHARELADTHVSVYRSAVGPFGRPRMGVLGKKLLALTLVLAPVLWTLRPLLHSDLLGKDHPVHLSKAWHFWTEMLAQGRLRGWSHYWGFGFPADEFVPSGAEIWIALFRLGTFGQLSWTRTYTLAYAAFLIFTALAAYWFARHYWGVAVGVLSALITFFDPGGWAQGGWFWHTYTGVWPVTLSMNFALLALVRVDKVLGSGGIRDVFWGGIWMAASLISHQFPIVVFAIALPFLFFDHWTQRQKPSGRGYARAIAAGSFGLALSAFSVLPMLTRSSNMGEFGVLGVPLSVVAERLVNLHVFDNVWPPIIVLGIIGGVIAVRAHRPGGVFLVAAAGVFMLLSSDALIRDLNAERVLPSLVKIEAQRMLLASKLFWFPLSAYAAVEVVRRSRQKFPNLRIDRRMARWLVGVALLVPIAAPAWRAFHKVQISKEFTTVEQIPYWQDLQPFFEWSRAVRLQSKEHYRIAYDLPIHDHISTVAPMFNETLLYKVGYTSSQMFRYIPMTKEPELLTALSVKYILTETALNPDHFTFERGFGQLSLYRFNGYRAEPFTLYGPGKAKLLTFEPEKIQIRLSGTTKESRLKLHVASFERWEATSGGRSLPISTVAVYGNEYAMLMEVPAVDGDLEFRYVRRPIDWVGLALSIFALPLFGGFVWLRRQRDPLRPVLHVLERSRRGIQWGAVAATLLAVGFFSWRTRGRDALLPPGSIFHRVNSGDMFLGERACTKEAALSFRCGIYYVRAEVVPGLYGGHLCMTTNSPGPLRIELNKPLGAFLNGRYDPPGRRGEIVVSVEETELGRIRTRTPAENLQFIQFDTRAYTGRTVPLKIELLGAALYCFDFQIVDPK